MTTSRSVNVLLSNYPRSLSFLAFLRADPFMELWLTPFETGLWPPMSPFQYQGFWSSGSVVHRTAEAGASTFSDSFDICKLKNHII